MLQQLIHSILLIIKCFHLL